MKKTKKLLALVLSLAMVLSCVVMPMSVSAADGDFIYKYTFDEATDATGVFGETAAYDVVAGTYPSTKHASAANLGADDKIAMLTPTNKGTVADGSAGSYLFGNNHSDTTGVRHATLQFDMQLNTGWNTFKVYPASTAGCSARLGFDIKSDADAAQPLRALNAATTPDWTYTDMGTIARHTWYEFAIEYDLDAGKAILYKDGVAIHTIEGVTGTATPNDFIFQYGGENANGAVYVNNLYYYEGGYNANVADPIYPYIDYDFTDAADATTLTSTTQVAGLAGKAASDMVGKVTGTTNASGWGAWYKESVLTAEAQVYVPDGKIEIYAGSNQSGEDRPGVALRNGKAGYVNAATWAYTDLVDYDKTIWHKVALEQIPSAKTVKVYLDGELIQTITDVNFNTNGICKDIRVQNAGYIDNYRIYAGSYVGDATIETPSAVVNDKFVIAEGAGLADAKATVTDGTAEFYTDDTYITVATTVETAKFVLINKGDLYKAYPVIGASKYGDAEVTNFNTSALGSWTQHEPTVATDFVGAVGGKDASDLAYMIETNFWTGARIQRGYANTVWAESGKYTIEAQFYSEDSAQQVGFQTRLKDAEDNNVDVSYRIDKGDFDTNEWIKLAMEVDLDNDTVKIYRNGVEVAGAVETDISAATKITDDWRVYLAGRGEEGSDDAAHAVGYMDNVRLYAGEYKGDEAPAFGAASYTFEEGTKVAAALTETGADFIVDANGTVITDTNTEVSTGMKAVKVLDEVYAYADLSAEHTCTYGDTTYTWATDYSSCTAERECTKDSSHKETVESIGVADREKTPANCMTMGWTTYTATFDPEVTWATTQEEDVQDIPTNDNHEYGDVRYEWATDYSACTALRVCENNDNHVDVAYATNIGVVTVPATEGADGMNTYTATFAEAWAGTDTEEEIIPALGHTHAYGAPTYEWKDNNTKCIAKRVCTDPNHVETEEVATTSQTTPATCTETGETVYTATFTVAWATTQTQRVEISALQHAWGAPTYEWIDNNTKCIAKRVCGNDTAHEETEEVTTTSQTTPATCTETGETVYTATFTVNWATTQTQRVEISALQHAWGAASACNWAADGSACTVERVCTNDGNHKEIATATITSAVKTPATTEAKGWTTYTATFTEDWAQAAANKTLDVEDIDIIQSLPAIDIEESRIINKYTFDNDTNMPWTVGSIVAGTNYGKAETDGVYEIGSGTGFAGNAWDAKTGKTSTTLQFDAYFTAETAQLKIWGASGNNKNRPAFVVKPRDVGFVATLSDGPDTEPVAATVEGVMPTGQWIRFAIKYDVVNGAKLYMYKDGAMTEVASMAMTGHTETPCDFSIAGNDTYLDNIIFYDSAPAPEFSIQMGPAEVVNGIFKVTVNVSDIAASGAKDNKFNLIFAQKDAEGRLIASDITEVTADGTPSVELANYDANSNYELFVWDADMKVIQAKNPSVSAN